MLRIIIAMLSLLIMPLNNAMGIEKMLYQKDSLYSILLCLRIQEESLNDRVMREMKE